MSERGIIKGLRANGEEFPAEASISQQTLNGKKLYTVILADITERKQAEQVRANLAAIVENSNDAIFSRSLDGTILTWNAGAERLLGYTAEEAVGKPATFNLPPGRQPNMARNSEKVLSGKATAPH